MQRPLVTLAYAQSLDGAITVERGQSSDISGKQSLWLTHQLRAMHAGIMVGVGTLLADNPQLNVRYAAGANPRPVVLDSQLRTPVDARLLTDTRHPLLFCDRKVDLQRLELHKRAGFTVLSLGARQGRLDLGEVLEKLVEVGVTSLMVEGGGEVLQSFLTSGLWDLAVITIAPQWMGGYRVVSERLAKPVRLNDPQVELIGEDIVIAGKNEQQP